MLQYLPRYDIFIFIIHISCVQKTYISYIQSSVVQTSKGNKIYTKEEFTTLDQDGKIKTEYGMRMKQGGGEIKVCYIFIYYMNIMCI